MITLVAATVVGGTLRLDESLQLPDQTRVNLTVEPLEEKPDPVVAWESIKARLRERPIRGEGIRYTRDELNERD